MALDPKAVEVDLDDDDKLEIDIVDDTPEADRGKKPLAEDKDDAEAITTDEDISKYNESVQKRIKKTHRLFHDERRAKEAALREREEAVAFAKQAHEYAKQLQKQLSEGSVQLIDTTKSAADAALDAAKRKYKEAYDAGDADKMAEAQDELAAARYKKEQAEASKPLQFKENEVYNQPQQVAVPKPDDKALDWQAENDWFGQDEEMTSFALGLHQKLVKEGVNPTSDKYYERIDKRMRQVFPDYFGSDETDDTPAEKPTSRAPKGNVVAPATRSTSPKRVTLTATQVALAKRLGLTNEQYAQELLKLRG